jgi:hypothetical protein
MKELLPWAAIVTQLILCGFFMGKLKQMQDSFKSSLNDIVARVEKFETFRLESAGEGGTISQKLINLDQLWLERDKIVEFRAITRQDIARMQKDLEALGTKYEYITRLTANLSQGKGFSPAAE